MDLQKIIEQPLVKECESRNLDNANLIEYITGKRIWDESWNLRVNMSRHCHGLWLVKACTQMELFFKQLVLSYAEFYLE